LGVGPARPGPLSASNPARLMQSLPVRFSSTILHVAFVSLLITIGACAPPDEASHGEASPTGEQSATTAPNNDLEFLPGMTADLGYPFSEAVRAGNILFLSGQVGILPDNTIIEGGVLAETRQIMENIKAVLEANGLGMEHIAKCTVMLDDMSQWGAVNDVYVEYFPGPKPARSAFGADGLALGAAVEIECMAHVPSR